MAFIAPPDAAVESYTDLLSSSPPEKRLQRNSTGRQATPPPDRRLQHSRSRSTLDEMLGSKRYIPSGPRPLVSHLSFSSSATSASSSASSFVQQPPQDQLSRSNSARLNRPHPLSVTRQQSTPPSEGSYLPRASSSTSVSVEASYLPPLLDLGAPWTALTNPSEIVTPGIGQGKEAGAPVAGPTVVPLSPSEMIWTETSALTTSSMGLFASKPQNSDVGGYDYDAHRRARSTQREEDEREKRRQRSGSQSDSPPPPRSRSRHRDSPPRQGRPRTRPVTPALSRSSSRSPSPRTKTIPHVAAVPYPSQQLSEMSYMFFDPELHGVGPPPPPPRALRALSSQANMGTKTTTATPTAPAAVSTTSTPSDPSIPTPSKQPPPRPPRRMSPPRPARSAQTDATVTARSAPSQSSYTPTYNYTSMHGVYMQSQPASSAPASAYQAATPADFVQQGYYQAAAAPMIPLYSAPAAIQTHTLATSAASSPYYASAAPPTSSNTGARHTREPAYEPATVPLPTVFAAQTPAVQQQSLSQQDHRDESTTLERNTSVASTKYSYTSTDSRTTQTSASSAAYTESSFDNQRRTSKRDSRPSSPTRSEDTFGQSSRTGDSYTTGTYVSSPLLHPVSADFMIILQKSGLFLLVTWILTQQRIITVKEHRARYLRLRLRCLLRRVTIHLNKRANHIHHTPVAPL
jgi:hypothetical protein